MNMTQTELQNIVQSDESKNRKFKSSFNIKIIETPTAFSNRTEEKFKLNFFDNKIDLFNLEKLYINLTVDNLKIDDYQYN